MSPLAKESLRLAGSLVNGAHPRRPLAERQAVRHNLAGVRDGYLAGRVPSEALAAARDTVAAPGHPLDPGLRADLEPGFRHSFADVRVHSDARAGRSALALGAEAYAVGRHIVFAPQCYQPHRSEGRALIEHELGHVTRSEHGARPAPLRVAEADHLRSHAAVPAEPGVIHRSLLGATLGGLGGAALGAVGGALLGSLLGPVGAIAGGIAGGLIGGIAGVVGGETLTADVRPLNADERREAYQVFGANLDYDRIRLGESAIMGAGENARTPFETIYFPPGAQASADFIPWLIHELTHVWQTQHGISVVTKVWWALHALTGNPYDYGDEKGLKEAAGKGKGFRDFNTEQQGDICRDYYRVRRADGDTSAYDPFIREVKGLPGPLSRDDTAPGAGDFPTTTPNLS